MNLKEILYQIEWLGRQYARHLAGLPSEWEQSQWCSINESKGTLCGARACLAGNVALHNGYKPKIVPDEYWSSYENKYIKTFQVTNDWLDKDGNYAGMASHVAEEILGASRYVESDDSYTIDLFDGDNDFQTMMDGLRILAQQAAQEPQNKALAKRNGLL